MSDLREIRRFYARLVCADAQVTSPSIVDAFAAVPREAFFGDGPWQIPTASGYISTESTDPACLYQDILIALDPVRRVNSGQPSLHARCLAAAAPELGERAVHIGAGSGYYTAILAHLLGGSGSVAAYELDVELAVRATENLRGYPTVRVSGRSAVDAALPQSDIVYVSAGMSTIPAPWLDALTFDGRLVMPLTPTGEAGHMWLITRRGRLTYSARTLTRAVFIPCVGGQHQPTSDALAATLRSGGPDQVRSLRRAVQPDETAWLVGDGWWLSTADV